jgi:Zn-dependent protease with chaperone function
MLLKFFNHFRLTWRLSRDKRASIWLKIFLLGLPLAYASIPTPGDLLPGVGLLDDLVFMGLCSLIFVAISPLALVTEHRNAISGKGADAVAHLDGYRYPKESSDLAFGFVVMMLLLALSGYLGGLLGALLFGVGYISSAMMRARALSNSVQVTEQQLPHLYQALQRALSHLPPVKVQMFVTQEANMNAFAFGYEEPYSIVVTSGLVANLADDELQAVIGHELGHIYYGHARLISLMAGATPIRWLFYKWSRSCEYSADAIALLASGGNPKPVVTALLKLSSGLTDIHMDIDAFLAQLKQDTASAAAFAEWGSTHPFINNRIQHLLQHQEIGI